jgi:flagellar biosynthetic protein FliR
MEIVFNQLLALLMTLWWPFCRVLAMLSAAPVLGDLMMPVTVRVLLALILAFVLLPATQGSPIINPWSMHGIAVTLEQAMVGGMIGLAFHLIYAVMMVLGYLVSSQIGFSMAVMNDPMNGTSSDVISSLLYVLSIFVFFAIDGHLVLVNIVGASFKAWPVGSGIDALSLQTLVFNVSWVFSAALLLAIPIIFSTFVVQMGTGLLNRIAPSFNLFSLGFSLVTLFGLFMLMHMIRFIPDHYLRMTHQVLDMLQHSFRAVPHG